MLFAATSVTSVQAMTQEEMQASAERVEKLKSPLPKQSGISEFDNVSAESKTVADATVSIANATSALVTGTTVEELEALTKRIKEATAKLADIGKSIGNLSGALKELKNPMKIKPATNQINYSKEVVQVAGEELVHQGKLVAAMLATL